MFDIKKINHLLIKLTEMGKLSWEETGEKIDRYEKVLKGRKTFINEIEIKISLMYFEKSGLLGSSNVEVGGLIISNGKETITFTTDKRFLPGEEVDNHLIFYLAYQIQEIVESKNLERSLIETLSLMFHS